MQTETAYANKLREEVLAKKDPEERQKCIDYMNKLAEKVWNSINFKKKYF